MIASASNSPSPAVAHQASGLLILFCQQLTHSRLATHYAHDLPIPFLQITDTKHQATASKQVHIHFICTCDASSQTHAIVTLITIAQHGGQTKGNYDDARNLYYVGNDPVNYIDPLGLELEVMTSNGFNIPGVNHTWLQYTPVEGGASQNAGMSGFLGKPGKGDGGRVPNAPGVPVTIPDGMTEQEVFDLIDRWSGWNKGPYLLFINDCHNQLRRAFRNAGIPFPKNARGRTTPPRKRRKDQ